MVATLGLLTDQVTWLVMFDVLGVAEPICCEPTAVNCTVWPTLVSCTEPAPGRIEMSLSELHPAKDRASGSTNIEKRKDAGRREIIGKLLHPSYGRTHRGRHATSSPWAATLVPGRLPID